MIDFMGKVDRKIWSLEKGCAVGMSSCDRKGELVKNQGKKNNKIVHSSQSSEFLAGIFETWPHPLLMSFRKADLC